MFDIFSYYVLTTAVLGLVLVIPPNTCIVIVNLETIRKEGKLSPSDAIFLAKAIVNVLLQCVLSLQGILSILYPGTLNTRYVHSVILVSAYFFIYYSFWLTAWLSVHYCTSITNLSSGFFIWIKRAVSHSLGQVLVLTALGVFPVSILVIWAFITEIPIRSSENITVEVFSAKNRLPVIYSYYVPTMFLGCILPFCLSLLCLLLTVSFLVRHVWRVKNNDSGSTRPNLQAHVTALRTIFFFLLMFSFFFASRAILFVKLVTEPIVMFSRTFHSLSTSVEAAIIIQASNNLRKVIVRRFWTRS